MGLTNESEEEKFITSFSVPYSPSFYINNKIYDKNKTIQSIIEESLDQNNNIIGKK